MMLLKLLLVIATLYSTATSHSDIINRRYNVLDFGITHADYVSFKPDMSPISNMFTICAWVKPRLDGLYRTWFDYTTTSIDEEIRISDSGAYTDVLNDGLDVQSSFDRSIGTWHHQCLAWDYSSATKNVFQNGALIGTEKMSSNRLLGMSGTLLLGWEMDSDGAVSAADEIFGGQLYKMNIFSKFLTTSEIKNLYDSGFCGEEEELYGRQRFLKWEDILLEDKVGNVTEVFSGCSEVHELNKWNILLTAPYYMKDLTSDMIARLSEAQDWSILADFIGSNITDGFVRHFKTYHADEQ